MNTIPKQINFCVVYARTRKKVDKYFKVNRIRNKYVLDIKKMMDDEMEGDQDIMFMKILIFNKIQLAMEKGKDIYFIPNFDDEFSINKLLNLKKILGENNFNILIFHDEFKRHPQYLEEALENLIKFDYSQVIKDY
tara:strand:+ start:499 stop:906 length:408 start_codon:yes stop_codon:yes gene_type:complete